MARANLFNPFSSHSPEYENRLTWAFLVALNYDPLLQNIFRQLVESKLPLEGQESSDFCESANIYTQTKWIDPSTSRLVSILLTDETIEDIKVQWDDREAKYDGVIEYPDGLTLIVENKLSHGNVWAKQLCPSRGSFQGNTSDVVLHDSAICLEWPEILEQLLKYAHSGVAPFSSRNICLDFLTFVEDIHPNLTPYRTFRLCDNRVEALNRRTRRLVGELGTQLNLESRDGWYLFRTNKIAERIGIWAETKLTLDVKLWPAATVRQAYNFYKNVDRTAFLSLEQWRVVPDLHFSYIQKILINAKTAWPIESYFDYFADGQPFGQMSIETLVPLAKQWESEGLISSDDLRELLDQHDNTNRETLNVIPGFAISRAWDLDTVIDLEEQGLLEKHITASLNTALSSWRETL